MFRLGTFMAGFVQVYIFHANVTGAAGCPDMGGRLI
jgi:hypothetical protein